MSIVVEPEHGKVTIYMFREGSFSRTHLTYEAATELAASILSAIELGKRCDAREKAME